MEYLDPEQICLFKLSGIEQVEDKVFEIYEENVKQEKTQDKKI